MKKIPLTRGEPNGKHGPGWLAMRPNFNPTRVESGRQNQIFERTVASVRFSKWRASIPVSPGDCEVGVLWFVSSRFAPELLNRLCVKADSREDCSRDIIDVNVK
ncbi:hypothetical protein TNCV_2420271 [Trichonephila clavipes]|nr:hypothetical protein TNCV_2420271 [Trichonephila clavipes]